MDERSAKYCEVASLKLVLWESRAEVLLLLLLLSEEEKSSDDFALVRA